MFIISTLFSIAIHGTSRYIITEDGSLTLDLPMQSLALDDLALAAPGLTAMSADKSEDTTSKYRAAYAALFLARRQLHEGSSLKVTYCHYDILIQHVMPEPGHCLTVAVKVYK